MVGHAAADFVEAAEELAVCLVDCSISVAAPCRNSPACEQYQQDVNDLHHQAYRYAWHVETADRFVRRIDVCRKDGNHQHGDADRRGSCGFRQQQSDGSGKFEDSGEDDPRLRMRKRRWNDGGIGCGADEVADRGNRKRNGCDDPQQPLHSAERPEFPFGHKKECAQHTYQ